MGRHEGMEIPDTPSTQADSWNISQTACTWTAVQAVGVITASWHAQIRRRKDSTSTSSYDCTQVLCCGITWGKVRNLWVPSNEGAQLRQKGWSPENCYCCSLSEQKALLTGCAEQPEPGLWWLYQDLDMRHAEAGAEQAE